MMHRQLAEQLPGPLQHRRRHTGQAGDVFLCHPFLVHAASWPHRGRLPRMMAQPGVALHDAFPLVPPLSPAELAMTAAAPAAPAPAQPAPVG